MALGGGELPLEQIEAGELLVQAGPPPDLLGPALIPLAEIEVAEPAERLTVVRLQGEGALVGLLGQRRLIVAELARGQGGPGVGEIGSDPDREAEVVERLVLPVLGDELPPLSDQQASPLPVQGRGRGFAREAREPADGAPEEGDHGRQPQQEGETPDQPPAREEPFLREGGDRQGVGAGQEAVEPLGLDRAAGARHPERS